MSVWTLVECRKEYSLFFVSKINVYVHVDYNLVQLNVIRPLPFNDLNLAIPHM